MSKPMIKVAHDPGDAQITSHCPFCGSGQIVGRSDGNIECEFCGMAYLVRVQPMFTGMPGNPMGGGFGGDTSVAPDLMAPEALGPDGEPIMGQPGVEGTPGAQMAEDQLAMGGGPTVPGGPGALAPGDEGAAEDEGFPPGDGEEEEGGGPPFGAGEGEDSGGEDSESEDAGPPPSKKKDKGKSKKEGALGGTSEEKAHYTRGWNTSQRASFNTNPNYSALERADDKGEPDAWYWGYMDHATDRPRGHSLECRGVDHDAPGCTLMAEGRLYTTIAGDRLPEDAYIRHLAALHGGVAVLRQAS